MTAEVKEAALKAAISQGIDPQEAPLPAITGKCLVDMLHVLPSEIRAGDWSLPECLMNTMYVAFALIEDEYVKPSRFRAASPVSRGRGSVQSAPWHLSLIL